MTEIGIATVGAGLAVNPNGARLRLYAHNAQFGEVTVGGQDPAETCYFPLGATKQ
jgi:hypothetical protein